MPRTLFSSLMLPTEGVYSSRLPQLSSLPVRTFLPTGYEANYAYPLIVFFHPHGGSDEQVLRLAPRISRRNSIYVGLQGPVPLNLTDDDGLPDGYEIAHPCLDPLLSPSSEQYGSSSGAPADTDGDGVSDLEEFKQGTDPCGAGAEAKTARDHQNR